MGEASLDFRFADSLRSLGVGDEPLHLLVGLSGGLDSTVLLHLLRFRMPSTPLTLAAAHFDHRMRTSSGRDAEWVRGLCRVWEVPLESGAAPGDLSGEEDARNARYHFLHTAAKQIGADAILTAHHADDQAETVLFRALRGTGIPGLAGIARRTSSGVLRPLLPFWRAELEGYARANHLGWCVDPTNVTLEPARNRIRLRILPEIEREIAPAARRNLVALADLARESERGWRTIVRAVLGRILKVEDGDLLLDRAELRRYHPAVGSRVVRKALGEFGIVLDRTGTRSALQFITDAPSGREMQLSGGVSIRIEFESARIEQRHAPPGDIPLEIGLLERDTVLSGELRLGGRLYSVSACITTTEEPASTRLARWTTRVPFADLHFPLLLRGRLPGDRIRTTGGTKSLRKLMIERRVPVRERSRRPVLIGADGTVLWVAGCDVDRRQRPLRQGGRVLELAVADA